MNEYLTINKLSKEEIVVLLKDKAGITNAEVLTDTDFLLLRSGRMCESLLHTNFNKFIPENLVGKVDENLCKIKLNVVKSIGEIRPVIVRKYNELKIPNTYMGYQFSNFEITQLKNFGRLTSLVNVEYSGIKSEGIISVDKDLNLVKFLPTEKISIPKAIGKNILSDDKINGLRNGFPILIPEFERNDGKKFSAIVEINNDGVAKGKFAISGIDQWIENQKKAIAKMDQIFDLQFEMLENRIKVKSLKL